MIIILLKKHALVKKKLDIGTELEVTNGLGEQLIKAGIAKEQGSNVGPSEKIVEKATEKQEKELNLNNNTNQEDKKKSSTKK